MVRQTAIVQRSARARWTFRRRQVATSGNGHAVEKALMMMKLIAVVRHRRPFSRARVKGACAASVRRDQRIGTVARPGVLAAMTVSGGPG